jgi:protein-tyrosine phosphatase
MTIPAAPSDCYWVLPGRLLAGRYPGSRYVESETERIVWKLLQTGVSSLVDLTRPDEMPPYRPALEQTAGFLNRVVHYWQADLPQEDIPTVVKIRTILDYIDTELAAGQVVYVHCRAGIDRTGTVIGCYLAQHGRGDKSALQTLAELRGPIAMLSPASDELRQFVANWPPYGKS